ncbi:kinase-like domain-containing protein [Mycena belliarum]|uniref:Kinase-like domain-containing protein n=1 Tax=Mycena belliarum TaxID=1033014 RepID=A0AAD6XN62_9AGAR|nr:kinase-like domain-containing protein [Mycena belliae]
MFAIFSTLVSCLKSSISNVQRVRCKVVHAVEDAAALSLAALVKLVGKKSKGVRVTQVPPAPTRTTPLNLAATPSYPAQAPPEAFTVVLTCFGALVALLLVHFAFKTGLASYLNSLARGYLKGLKTVLLVGFVSISLFVAGSTSKVYVGLQAGSRLLVLHLNSYNSQACKATKSYLNGLKTVLSVGFVSVSLLIAGRTSKVYVGLKAGSGLLVLQLLSYQRGVRRAALTVWALHHSVLIQAALIGAHGHILVVLVVRRASLAAWYLRNSVLIQAAVMEAYGRVVVVLVVRRASTLRDSVWLKAALIEAYGRVLIRLVVKFSRIAGHAGYGAIVEFVSKSSCILGDNWRLYGATINDVFSALSRKPTYSCILNAVAAELSGMALVMGYGAIADLIGPIWGRALSRAILHSNYSTSSSSDDFGSSIASSGNTKTSSGLVAIPGQQPAEESASYGTALNGVASPKSTVTPYPSFLLEHWSFPFLWEPSAELSFGYDLDAAELQVGKHIASGGFGEVCEATGPAGCLLAVKRIGKVHPSFPEYTVADDLFDELSVHYRMRDHPAFLSVYGVFEDEDSFYVVMERGRESFSRLKLNTPAIVLFYAAQLVLALQRLHQRGILHADLKPSNLLRDAKGNLLIIDFGISTVFDHSDFASGDADTTDNFPLLWPGPDNPHSAYIKGGTVGFRSPASGMGECSFGADLFAVGVIIHRWMTGQAPLFDDAMVWVPNDELPDGRAPLDEDQRDFLFGLFSWTAPARFESWAQIKGHPVWDKLPPEHIPFPLSLFLLPTPVENQTQRSPTPAPVEVANAASTTTYHEQDDDREQDRDGGTCAGVRCGREERSGRWRLRHPTTLTSATTPPSDRSILCGCSLLMSLAPLGRGWDSAYLEAVDKKDPTY